MRNLVFFKKELRESIKTKKILIIPAIYLLFGFMSPLYASPMASKYLSELMVKSLKEEGMSAEGFKIIPHYLNSYTQFFSNIGSMCMIALILFFMGMVVDEKVRGTAILVLTKYVSRTQFILSKFFAAAAVFTVSYILSSAACIYYTYALFPQFYHENLWISILVFWVYSILIISITLLASTIAKSHVISALMSFAGFAVLSALVAIPYVGKFTPGYLGTIGVKILKEAKVSDVYIPLTGSLVLIIALVFCSVWTFRKQEI